jgi:hypothetical protein
MLSNCIETLRARCRGMTVSAVIEAVITAVGSGRLSLARHARGP